MSMWDWKKDKEYMDYINSGESMAVYIVRDMVKAVDTRGKWIDVISLSMYYKKEKPNFNWIVVELFPRKIHPQYEKNATEDYNRYLTWLTAHKDISIQRKKGFEGIKFLVLCRLYNKNRGMFEKRKVCVKKYWEPLEAYREKVIKEPVEPDWAYRVQAVRKVNNKQVKFIEDNEGTIIEKIRKQGKIDLQMLGL